MTGYNAKYNLADGVIDLLISVVYALLNLLIKEFTTGKKKRLKLCYQAKAPQSPKL